MRVLHVARRYPSYDAPGRGAAVRELVSGAAHHGVDARVVSFDRVVAGGRGPEQRQRLRDEARKAYDAAIKPNALFRVAPSWGGVGVPVARLPLVQGPSVQDPEQALEDHLDAVRPFARGLFDTWRPDLLHAHSGFPDGVVAAVIGKEHGIPVVVSAEGGNVEEAFSDPHSLELYRDLLERGARPLVDSPRSARWLADALGVAQARLLALREPDVAGEPEPAARLFEVYQQVADTAAAAPPEAGAHGPGAAGDVVDRDLPMLLVASRRGLAIRLVEGLPRKVRRRSVLVVPPPSRGAGGPDRLGALGITVVESRQRGEETTVDPCRGLASAVLTAARSRSHGGRDVDAVALDTEAAAAIATLEADGVRLAPGSLRWLADRWDAERSIASENAIGFGAATYEPKGYWGRLHARRELSAVGQSALPTDLNVWLYRVLESNLRRFVGHRHLLDGVDAGFDVGAGSGYWVDVWHDLGIPRVDGCDLVPDAVARLGERFGDRGDTFVAADIGSADLELPWGRYGLVSVLNVLLHVTDDTAFETALRNVARLVRPGGHLLLVEPALEDERYERPHNASQHSRARRTAAYVEPLLASGLELIAVQGAVAAANNPIEARSSIEYRAFQRWWRWVSRTAKRKPGRIRLVGVAMLALDRAALMTGAAPSSKFLLLRRPAEGDSAAGGESRGGRP
jgi:SAM-dependent methyltransferase